MIIIKQLVKDERVILSSNVKLRKTCDYQTMSKNAQWYFTIHNSHKNNNIQNQKNLCATA